MQAPEYKALALPSNADNPANAQNFLKNKIKEYTGQFTGHAAGERMDREKTIKGFRSFDDGGGLQLIR